MRKIVLLFAVLYCVASCKKNSSNDRPSQPSQPFVSYFSDTSDKPLGCVASTYEQLQSIPYISDADTFLLPELSRPQANSWTINVPTPDSQRNGSCTAWALAYGTMSYQFGVLEGNLDFTNLSNVFSPAFIYNQLNRGKDSGISYIDAINFIGKNGCCKWPDMPADVHSYTVQPTSTAIANAVKYRYASAKRLPNDIELIKKWVRRNYPIPFAAWVDAGFMKGKEEGSFHLLPDGRLVWRQLFSPAIKGKHAMVICGYDDNISAFKVLNSWGPRWANDGYVWIDYDHFLTVLTYVGEPEIYLLSPLFVVTNAAVALTDKTAVSHGTIITDGGSTVTARGVCWNTSGHPTIDDSKTVEGGETGIFASFITGLTPNIKYYVRAYAINSNGTFYGNEVNFMTYINDGSLFGNSTWRGFNHYHYNFPQDDGYQYGVLDVHVDPSTLAASAVWHASVDNDPTQILYNIDTYVFYGFSNASGTAITWTTREGANINSAAYQSCHWYYPNTWNLSGNTLSGGSQFSCTFLDGSPSSDITFVDFQNLIRQ